MKTKIIACTNQKGGVGKTTTAVNLARYLGRSKFSNGENRKVLLIDLDPQGNTTDYCGVDKDDERLKNRTIAEIYKIDATGKNNAILENLIIPLGDIDLICANDSLETISDTFQALPNIEYKNFQLREKLNALLSNKKYDYVIIDCRPSKGILVRNAILASNNILVPVQPEKFSVNGIAQLIDLIDEINANLSHFSDIEPKKINGALITMCSLQGKANIETAEKVKQNLKDLDIFYFNTIIRRNVALSKSTDKNKCIFDYDKSSAGATDYENFAKEIIAQEEG